MRTGDIPPHVREHLLRADAFIAIVEDLSNALDVIKVVYLAMQHPDHGKIWQIEPCQAAISRAIDVADRALNRASTEADEIQRTAPW